MSATDHLNPQLFAQQVSKTGGASMNLNSGRLVQPGQSGYMVGGESDRSGGAIPSWNVPESEFGPEHVSKFAAHVQDATGNARGMHVGGWKSDGQVYLDASRKVKRPKQATRMGKSRNQISVWDNKHMREIPTGGTGE
jgi:hypothetical protein